MRASRQQGWTAVLHRRGTSAAAGYAAAIVCVAGAALLTRSLEYTVFPTPLFFAAIVISTWIGGVGPGLAAVALSTLVLSYLFVLPLRNLSPGAADLPYLLQFGVPALLTCWFVKKRKDAEMSLTRARDELDSRVQERTAELSRANHKLQVEIAERIRAEETVQKTQADLAHITRMMTMGELAASIAHEINQPLMAVVINGDACLQWLGAEPPNLPEAQEAVTRMIEEGTRAGEIIRRIRGLSKKTAPRKVELDLNDLIRDVLTLTQREILRNHVTVRTELSPGLLLGLGDRVQLQQVILNLVMNALEAMGNTAEGSRELLVSSGITETGDLVVSVRDTGPGFPLEQAEQLFDAFFTTKQQGLGMGLSISRTIIEAHEGRLWAESTAEGAVFRFRLPAIPGYAA